MMKGRYVDDIFGDDTILSSIPKDDRLDSSDVHIDDNLVVHSLGLL